MPLVQLIIQILNVFRRVSQTPSWRSTMVKARKPWQHMHRFLVPLGLVCEMRAFRALHISISTKERNLTFSPLIENQNLLHRGKSFYFLLFFIRKLCCKNEETVDCMRSQNNFSLYNGILSSHKRILSI